MSALRKRCWILIFLLAATVGGSRAVENHRSFSRIEVRLDMYPQVIDGWQMTYSRPLEPEVAKALHFPDGHISRRYEREDGSVINLTIIYNQNQRWGAHRPEFCHRGHGWNPIFIGTKNLVQIELPNGGFKVNKFLVGREDLSVRKEILYWWYSSNNVQTPYHPAQMLNNMKAELLTGHSDSGFIMIETHYDESNQKEKEEMLLGFAEKIYPILPRLIEEWEAESENARDSS